MNTNIVRLNPRSSGGLSVLLLMLVLLFSLSACGGSPAGVSVISQTELLAAIDAKQSPIIIDVRSPNEYKGGHVPGAINISHTEIAQRLDELSGYKDKEAVVYCERGARAGKAEAVLLKAGFSQVRHLEGDMRAWRSKGLVTE